MSSASVDDSLMQPDPADDLPLLTDVPEIPAPSMWQEPARQRQARQEAWAGLQQLARMVEPVLPARPVSVDIDLDVLTHSDTAVSQLPDAAAPGHGGATHADKAYAVSQSTQMLDFSWFPAGESQVTSCKIQTGRINRGTAMQGTGHMSSASRGFSSGGTVVREEAVNDAFRISALPAMNEHLTDIGQRLMQAIPVAVRPLITAKRHPHIINKMAVLWSDPKDLAHYFDELLLSSRPGRRGFAIEVLDELVGLQRALQERHRI